MTGNRSGVYTSTLENLPRGCELLARLEKWMPSGHCTDLRSQIQVVNPDLNIEPQAWWRDSFDWYVAINLRPGSTYQPLFRHGEYVFAPQIGIPEEKFSEKQCFFGFGRADCTKTLMALYKIQDSTNFESIHEISITVPVDCLDAYMFVGPVKGGTGFQANPNRRALSLIISKP